MNQILVTTVAYAQETETSSLAPVSEATQAKNVTVSTSFIETALRLSTRSFCIVSLSPIILPLLVVQNVFFPGISFAVGI